MNVVTLTFSPALDVATSTEVVAPSNKLRCGAPSQEPGGGGINVARVVKRLGTDAFAVAPLGGDRGRIVVEQLEAEGLVVEQVSVGHTIRQSFAVTEESTGHQYRFVLPAPNLDVDETKRCVDAACELGATAGCVVISGSIAVPSIHQALSEIVATVDPTPVIIDTSGPALAAALQSDATLVKPSARELAEFVGTPLETEQDITRAAVETLDRSSVDALLVSIGAGGAVLAQRGHRTTRFRAPTVRVRSAIGAGDSLVGGIASELASGANLIHAVRVGIAAGTATVMSDGTGLCDPVVAHELLEFVTVDA